MSREREPTPLRASASQAGAPIDTAALEAAVNEEAVQRALRAIARKVFAWLGLPLAGGLAGYGAAQTGDQPAHREQPASGPAPAPDGPEPSCTPAERAEIVELQDRAIRADRTAADACSELASKIERQRKEAEQ